MFTELNIGPVKRASRHFTPACSATRKWSSEPMPRG